MHGTNANKGLSTPVAMDCQRMPLRVKKNKLPHVELEAKSDPIKNKKTNAICDDREDYDTLDVPLYIGPKKMFALRPYIPSRSVHPFRSTSLNRVPFRSPVPFNKMCAAPTSCLGKERERETESAARRHACGGDSIRACLHSLIPFYRNKRHIPNTHTYRTNTKTHTKHTQGAGTPTALQ